MLTRQKLETLLKTVQFGNFYNFIIIILVIFLVLVISNCNISYNDEDILQADAVVFHLHKVANT